MRVLWMWMYPNNVYLHSPAEDGALMKIDDLASKHDQATIFNLEYEFRINKLKLDFIALADAGPAAAGSATLAEEHQTGIAALRSFITANFTHFNAASCSSLSAIP